MTIDIREACLTLGEIMCVALSSIWVSFEVFVQCLWDTVIFDAQSKSSAPPVSSRSTLRNSDRDSCLIGIRATCPTLEEIRCVALSSIWVLRKPATASGPAVLVPVTSQGAKALQHCFLCNHRRVPALAKNSISKVGAHTCRSGHRAAELRDS